MIQMKIIKSRNGREHQDKFNNFCEIFNDEKYELRDVDIKVKMDSENFSTTYFTFIIYFIQTP